LLTCDNALLPARLEPMPRSSTILLGGLTPREFLARHWQKRPLLVRGAVVEFRGLLDPKQLWTLACRDDVSARLVTRSRDRWRLQQGPFSRAQFARMPKSNWTLLVHALNHLLPEADRLLRRFAFVPYARLDDLMVSFAAPGGGVGPHVDSYDVFLLQGAGVRRWQISAQQERALEPNLPLKILKHFRPEQEYVLHAGDMLYLPPGYAHCGTALDACMTYSIGFRAPSAQELACGFLDYLRDRLELDGMYEDPGLRLQRHPSEFSAAMLRKVGATLNRIAWTKRDCADFLGRYLTEPPARVFFSPPAPPLSQRAFSAAFARRGLALDLRSLMLIHDDTVYLNAEAYPIPVPCRPILVELGDRRALQPVNGADNALVSLLYQWYRAGYLGLVKSTNNT
jgi:50S ribosomal protein L16 3-hydroxylase